MEKKFSSIVDLINFIDQSPVEEVSTLLEQYGFEFVENKDTETEYSLKTLDYYTGYKVNVYTTVSTQTNLVNVYNKLYKGCSNVANNENEANFQKCELEAAS